MNDDDPLSELETRLRAWRPADMPAELRTRLHVAFRPTRRRGSWSRGPDRWPSRVLLGAQVLAAVVVLLWASRFSPSPEAGSDPVATSSPAPGRADTPTVVSQPRWLLGERLTMNIDTGVPAGIVPAALRLDGESVTGSGLFPIRSADGKLPLNVDCQF